MQLGDQSLGVGLEETKELDPEGSSLRSLHGLVMVDLVVVGTDKPAKDLKNLDWLVEETKLPAEE